jgi:hypothetical protein
MHVYLLTAHKFCVAFAARCMAFARVFGNSTQILCGIARYVSFARVFTDNTQTSSLRTTFV